MSQLYNTAAALPEFSDDPVQRLAHTLAAYPNRLDTDWALEATRNAIPGHDITGITWGDLRALHAKAEDKTERMQADQLGHCHIGRTLVFDFYGETGWLMILGVTQRTDKGMVHVFTSRGSVEYRRDDLVCLVSDVDPPR